MKRVLINRTFGIVCGILWGVCPSLQAAEDTPDAPETEAMAVPAADAPEMVDVNDPTDPLPPGVVTPWGRFGEDYAEGLLDVLLPLYFDNDLLLFTNIRGAYSDVSEQELNLGLGVRKRLDDIDTILGLNAYYDSRWTERDSQFNQLGIGAEVLSTWVDARANGYFPEDKKEHLATIEETHMAGSSTTTTYSGHGAGHTIYESERTRTVTTYVQNAYEIYDVPLEGYDVELGVKLPLSIDWLEARIFGGYYAFEPMWEGNLEDANDIDGFKGRAEFRIHDRILLDAEVFEDDRLFGSDYLISARVSLPFDLGAISRGENPFTYEPARESGISTRFTEMVMRDPHIQIRNETEVSTESFQETSTRTRTYAVLEDVIFVDGDNAADPAENGSAEHPFDVIQEGVDDSDARDLPNVFVHNADQPYVENVEVSETINLYGGAARFGKGTTPGDGTAPTVRPAGDGPFIFSFEGGEQVLLTGFTLDGAPGATPPVPVIGGALVSNVPNVVLRQNTFRDLPVGVIGMYDGSVSDFDMTVAENTFERNALAVGGLLQTSGTFTVADNTIQDSLLGVGVLGVNTSARAHTLISGNTMRYNTPLDPLTFPVVNELVEDFLPGSFPDELPLPMIGGVVVGAVNGKLSADIQNNDIQGPLLGITALSLNLYAPRTDLDLSITGNRVQGGGLADTVDLLIDTGLLDSLPLPIDPEDLRLPFDAGLSGIAALSIGPDARINDAVIEDNEVRDNLLGITLVAAADAKAKRGVISNNTLVDNGLGITALGISDGNLNRLAITGNTVDGGGLPKLVPLIERFTGPIPIEVPDASIAGITLLGFGTENMRNIVIDDNTVTDHALGVTAVSLQSNLKNLEVTGNTVDDNLSGVLLLGVGVDANLNNAIIADNTISGAGGAFVGDLIGLFLDEEIDFPDLGLAGVGVVAIDEARANAFSITNNTISDQLIGVAALGLGDAKLKNGIIADNTIDYGVAGIVGASIYDSAMNNLLIMDNDLTGVGINFPGGGLPIGPVTLFGDKALAGVGLLAYDGKTKDATIVGNTITNNDYGIAVLEDGGNNSGLTTAGNTFSNNTEDELINP